MDAQQKESLRRTAALDQCWERLLGEYDRLGKAERAKLLQQVNLFAGSKQAVTLPPDSKTTDWMKALAATAMLELGHRRMERERQVNGG